MISFRSGVRWAIEQCCEETKTALGMDHYEGRKYLGWHHHRLMYVGSFLALPSPDINETSGLPHGDQHWLWVMVHPDADMHPGHAGAGIGAMLASADRMPILVEEPCHHVRADCLTV